MERSVKKLNGKIAVLLLSALCLIGCSTKKETGIPVKNNQHIVLIGNNLASRMINFGHFLQALITWAKPEKNFFPVDKSLIEINSSKLAPAQNAFSPADLRMMTLTSSFDPKSVMVFVLEINPMITILITYTGREGTMACLLH